MIARILYCTAYGLMFVFAGAAVLLAVIPAALAIAFESLSDDLAGGPRRGREQNWLWRWARNQQGTAL